MSKTYFSISVAQQRAEARERYLPNAGMPYARAIMADASEQCLREHGVLIPSRNSRAYEAVRECLKILGEYELSVTESGFASYTWRMFMSGDYASAIDVIAHQVQFGGFDPDGKLFNLNTIWETVVVRFPDVFDSNAVASAQSRLGKLIQ
uniref:hypothetical protein n=2 Tax=Ruegeria TaxID=97050 RepID=UPI00147EEC63|nr:hypothetical protein [Ruegeria arenilitoris]